MKKIYLLLILDVYQTITPRVSVIGAHQRIDVEGEIYFRVPQEALASENTVWGLISEQGYSMIIYKIIEIEIEDIVFSDEYYVYFSNSINGASSIVGNATDVDRMGLVEGDKVIPKSSG